MARTLAISYGHMLLLPTNFSMVVVPYNLQGFFQGGQRGAFSPLGNCLPPWESRILSELVGFTYIVAPFIFWLVDFAPLDYISERNPDLYCNYYFNNEKKK